MNEEFMKWCQRLQANETKAEFANKIHVSLPTALAYLAGRKIPKRNKAFDIAKVLKLDDRECEELFRALYGKLVENESKNEILIKLLSAASAAGKAFRRERLLFKLERVLNAWQEAE